MPLPIPEHPVLAGVARAIDESGQAGLILDGSWNVVWASAEWVALIDVMGSIGDDLVPWLGTNLIRFALSPVARRIISERALMRAGIPMLRAMMADIPGGRDTVGQLLDAEVGVGARAVLDTLEPNPMPIWWSSLMVRPARGMGRTRTSWIGIRLFDPSGSLVGHALMFGTPLPFRYVPMLAMGDLSMFERLATLTEPARHLAVVLTADIQDSAIIARRLSTAAYFDLVTRMISQSDREIVTRGGVIGRHAGDGMIAFFLAEHLGGSSGAARAAIEVATTLSTTVDEATPKGGEPVLMNVALHSGDVYMGQLASEGRLEVTALGDAVNECARIGECARDGAVLASKIVIEQLAPGDAEALGIDPPSIVYQRVEDLATASTKAKRDAGGIAVTRLSS